MFLPVSVWTYGYVAVAALYVPAWPADSMKSPLLPTPVVQTRS
jgi:hypothetical protein